jgi:DNA-directed RNA polymerase specialized sigma24 family protein
MEAERRTENGQEAVMAAGILNLNHPRELLHEAIVYELRSWAELPRRIFMLVHYSGKSVQEVASQSGRNTGEVSRILQNHEHKLRTALKAFRAA